MMRKLLWVVLIAAIGWSAYWFIGARSTKLALETWFEARRAEGWQVEYSALTTRGYPNRFDTTVTDLMLTDPETGVSWSAPFFQLFSLSYDPTHIIAAWPNEQLIATPLQKITVETDEMTASVSIANVLSLSLDRATVVMKGARLSSSDDWDLGFETLNGAIRLSDGPDFTYDIAISADALSPSDTIRELIDRAGKLPKRINGFELEQSITFDAPLDRTTIETARPAITALSLDKVRAEWGELELRATGALDVDAEGLPSGEILLNAKNWKDMLDMAVDAGAIEEGVASTAEIGLTLLSRLSGSKNTIDAPLSFRAGSMFIGPVPLGRAPRLVLR